MLFNINYQTCLNMSKKNIHYPDHIIKYAMNWSGIETLKEGTVMMGKLEKVWWVVLKSGYTITLYYDLVNELYNLNNDFVQHNNK